MNCACMFPWFHWYLFLRILFLRSKYINIFTQLFSSLPLRIYIAIFGKASSTPLLPPPKKKRLKKKDNKPNHANNTKTIMIGQSFHISLLSSSACLGFDQWQVKPNVSLEVTRLVLLFCPALDIYFCHFCPKFSYLLILPYSFHPSIFYSKFKFRKFTGCLNTWLKLVCSTNYWTIPG